jgi:hypothetical protein
MKASLLITINYFVFSFFANSQPKVSENGMMLRYLSPYDSTIYCITGVHEPYYKDTVDLEFEMLPKDVIYKNNKGGYFIGIGPGDKGIYFPDSASLAYYGNSYSQSMFEDIVIYKFLTIEEGREMLQFKTKRIRAYESLRSKISPSLKHRVFKLTNGNILYFNSIKKGKRFLESQGQIWLFPNDFEFLVLSANNYTEHPFPFELYKH